MPRGELPGREAGSVAAPAAAISAPATRPGWRAALSLRFAKRAARSVLAGRTHDGPLVVQKPLYPEGHVVSTRPEDVLDGIATFDLGLALLVRCAVGGRFGLRAVAPVPFDRRAVVLLEVVGAADQLRRQDHARRRHADDRLRLQCQLRAHVWILLILVPVGFLWACGPGGCAERKRRRAGQNITPQRVDHRSGPRCSGATRIVQSVSGQGKSHQR